MKKSVDDLTINPVAIRTASIGACSAEIEIKLKVMVFREGDCYECYLRDDDHPYQYMFGLPKQSINLHDALGMAISNARQYIGLLEDEEN